MEEMTVEDYGTFVRIGSRRIVKTHITGWEKKGSRDQEEQYLRVWVQNVPDHFSVDNADVALEALEAAMGKDTKAIEEKLWWRYANNLARQKFGYSAQASIASEQFTVSVGEQRNFRPIVYSNPDRGAAIKHLESLPDHDDCITYENT